MCHAGAFPYEVHPTALKTRPAVTTDDCMASVLQLMQWTTYVLLNNCFISFACTDELIMLCYEIAHFISYSLRIDILISRIFLCYFVATLSI